MENIGLYLKGAVEGYTQYILYFIKREYTLWGVFGFNATMEKISGDLKNHQGRWVGKKDRIFVFQTVQNESSKLSYRYSGFRPHSCVALFSDKKLISMIKATLMKITPSSMSLHTTSAIQLHLINTKFQLPFIYFIVLFFANYHLRQ